MNVEFQRIARRDKEAFLSDQCKEIEENNRMGKTRDLFKKIRDTKGIFHAKTGSIKDRNGMDLIEAEDINERLLLNHANTLGFLAPGGEFNLGPETRLDHSELLCNKVLLKYKRDRES